MNHTHKQRANQRSSVRGSALQRLVRTKSKSMVVLVWPWWTDDNGLHDDVIASSWHGSTKTKNRATSSQL
jgi:hypothetical protein